MIVRLDDAQRRMLRLLRTSGGCSRAAVAESLSYTPTALTQLSKSLIDLGLAEEEEPLQSGKRGRPSTPIRIASGGGYSLGLALHRGVLEAALIDYAGRPIDRRIDVFDELPPRECARRVRRWLHDMVERNALLGRRFFGVGLGVPGPPRPDGDGRWTIASSLAGWRDEPLQRIFEDEIGSPVWIENDANAAALAEHYLGALPPCQSIELVVLLGHGLGAGVVAGGQLLRGAADNVGDIGCLFPGDSPRPSTVDLLGLLKAEGCRAASVADVEGALLTNADLIEAWLGRAARQLRSCIDAGVAWLNPARVVISSPLPRVLLKRMATLMNEVTWRDGYYSEHPLDVQISELGGAAIALGAAMLPIHSVEAC